MSEGRRFVPTARRRRRIAAGVLLAAIAVGGNIAVYTSLDDSEPVVQVTRDVPAGEQLRLDMLRTVDVDADPTVNLIAGDRIESLVGTYAKVRLVSGSLVTADALQASPLVANGNSVVAIQVPEGTLPIGLRERVPVELVIPGDGAPTTIPGRVVGLPAATGSTLGIESLSVEVDEGDAAVVASADEVRVVLVTPSPDPAAAPAGVGADGGAGGTAAPDGTGDDGP